MVDTTAEPPVPDRARSGFSIALIGLLGTIILAAAGVLGVIIQTRREPATLAATLGQRSISIDPTKDGTISHPTLLEGDVSGLQPGEMVWTFNQPTDPGEAIYYPNSGPCVVDYERKRWKCSRIYIGAPLDQSGFRVWAAIVSEQQAFDLVEALRHPEIRLHGNEPPHVLNAIASITGRRID